jgi:HSP20 family protein
MIKLNPTIKELIKLQEDIHHLLSDLTGKISGELYNSANQWTPNIDLSEDTHQIIVKTEVPGIAPAQLEIVFQDGCVHIRGEKKQPAHPGKVHYLCLERAYGNFCRTIYLTVAVDINAATAKLHNGVLTISLPKLSNRRRQEKTIPIESS